MVYLFIVKDLARIYLILIQYHRNKPVLTILKIHKRSFSFDYCALGLPQPYMKVIIAISSVPDLLIHELGHACHVFLEKSLLFLLLPPPAERSEGKNELMNRPLAKSLRHYLPLTSSAHLTQSSPDRMFAVSAIHHDTLNRIL